MCKNEVVIVIPLYKEIIDVNEMISLQRCFSILNDFPRCVVKPQSLSINENIKEQITFTESFDESYFKSIHDYNRLMLSSAFYERFISYKYILIYQLDCYVFKNELGYWCKKNLDYIGPPFIGLPDVERLGKNILNTRLNKIVGIFKKRNDLQTGNGGFSLRKVSKFLDILKINQAKVDKWIISGINEDIFWSYKAKTLNPFFRKADIKDAVKFGIENEPEACMKTNNQILPFGCHGWNKKYYDFWKNYIIELQ